jgi:NAD(P)-dependent dehydrogenase (short-subunit alcohol dehydrogenase family)
MATYPFIFIGPASRGLGLALTRHFLRTTELPVYATHRSGSKDDVQSHILEPLGDVDRNRLRLLRMDLVEEDSIAHAASSLEEDLRERTEDGKARAYMQTAFFTGGVLHPERSPADLDASKMLETFRVNTLSHLLAIKHFGRFLPPARAELPSGKPARWVHVSARVGSVSDNRLGGWYSYRASKAALNQVVKTWDIQLAQKRIPAIAIGVHPGTVRTDLSKDFWGGVKEGKLFEPDYAAERLAEVVDALQDAQRGRIWDWNSKEILP